ncbi:MAG: hypothetical protein ACYCZ6_15325 [Polaromonas sp.]
MCAHDACVNGVSDLYLAAPEVNHLIHRVDGDDLAVIACRYRGETDQGIPGNLLRRAAAACNKRYVFNSCLRNRYGG